MQHDAGTISTDDGLTLATRRWVPGTKPRGVVLIVHGLSEHSGRYAHVATQLLLHDFAVYSYDHRHHGRSGGSPRAYIEDFDRLVDDLRTVLHWVHSDCGDLPLFVYGHSLGGAIAARYVAINGSEGLAGLILSSAALRIPDDFSPVLRRLAPLLSRFLPRLPTVGDDRAHLSRDPSVLRAFMEDPLTYKGGLRARTGYQVLLNSMDILDHADAFRLPLLLLHGSADRITDPKGSRLLCERAPAEDKTLLVYDGWYHELHNEEERQRVLDDVTEWLEARTTAPAGDRTEAAAA